MKTRSKLGAESISPVLRRKTSKPALKDLHGSTDGQAVSYRTDVKGSDQRNKTPTLSRKREFKAHTPGKEDNILCSQHFDSQTVVGWDCNSPATLRHLAERKHGDEKDDVEDLVSRLIGKEPDDDILASRSTPPLLGLWHEKPKDQLDAPAGLHHRLRKRHGRQKKKSSSSKVSHELLEKLQVALNNCSDVDKETDGRNAEGELYLPDINELEELPEKHGSPEQLNVSTDLFDSFKGENVVSSTAKLPTQNTDKQLTVDINKKSRGRKSIELCEDVGDTTWSDDELFGNDSFIVHATQMPAPKVNKFTSPIIGKKRKSNSKELPKSKCVRYTNHVGESFGVNNTLGTESNGSQYTGLVAKPDSNGTNRGTINCAPKRSGVTTKPTVGKSSIGPSTTAVDRSVQPTDCNKNVISRAHVSLPCSTVRSNTVGPPGVQTSTLNSTSSTNCYQNTGNLTRSSSFKKHNSFSGHNLSSNPAQLNRQRSLSGNNQHYTCANTVQTSHSPLYTVKPALQHPGKGQAISPAFQNSFSSSSLSKRTQNNSAVNKNHHNSQNVARTKQLNIDSKTNVQNTKGAVSNNCKNTFLSNHTVSSAKCAISGDESLTSVVSSKGTKVSSNSPVLNKGQPIGLFNKGQSTGLFNKGQAAGVFNKSQPKGITNNGRPTGVFNNGRSTGVFSSTVINKDHSTGVFDTSLSDDLLYELAEPDDLLDSQLDVNMDSKTVVKSCTRESTSRGKSSHGLKPEEPVKKSVECRQGSCANKVDGPKKKFTFKPSQKSDIQNNHFSCQTKPENKILPGKKDIIEINGPAHTTDSVLTVTKQEDMSKVGSGSTCGSENRESGTSSNTYNDYGYSEDLFSDEDDMLVDGDGLSEAQIFAMLDQAEFMATQKSTEGKAFMESERVAQQSHKTEGKQPNKTVKPQYELTSTHNMYRTENLNISKKRDSEKETLCVNQDHQPSSQGHQHSSQGHQPSSQGHQHSSQGHQPSSQGHQPSSQGQQPSSQGLQPSSPMSCSQKAKYTAAEIERKKQMALERRQKRLQLSQLPKS